jgi:hypothetical protein
MTLTGGGAGVSPLNPTYSRVVDSRPLDNTAWYGHLDNLSGTPITATLTVYAICSPVTSD